MAACPQHPQLHLQAPAEEAGPSARADLSTQQQPQQPPPQQQAPPLQGQQPFAFHSHSSSFEADDERSATRSASYDNNTPDNHSTDSSSDFFPSTPHPHLPMAGHDENGFGDGGGSDSGGSDSDNSGRREEETAAVRTYPGEDLRPTSSKEILGWYMYAFASETYVICAIASFIPILLESLARENGVLLSDRTTPCRASNDRTPSLSEHLASGQSIFGPSTVGRSNADSQCVVYILGFEINTASFAMYTFSISVLLQALLVVSISCAADHGNYRKKLLLGFAAAGSVSVMLYLAVSTRVYVLGAVLAIVSNTSFGASFVLLNSFLPLLVRHHPTVLFGEGWAQASSNLQDGRHDDAGSNHHLDGGGDGNDSNDDHNGRHDGYENDNPNDSTTVLLPPPESHEADPDQRTASQQTSLELSLSTQISSKGIGIGYCAALLVQCTAILIVYRMHNTLWSQRVVLFVIGAWWGLFTIPAAMWLRPRPGPPLPLSGLSGRSRSRSRGNAAVRWAGPWVAYLVYAWRSLFRTIGLARRLLDIALFLAGWFLLSDAVATTSSTAVLFAKTQLHMEVWALGLINVISTATGVVGAFSWAWVSRRLGLPPLHTILACLVLFMLIPLYGLLGYLAPLRRAGVGGLQQPCEMFPLAAVYGLVLGGISSYCRALYGELIPPGSEAAFYALYAITDKGSSVFGPAIVGAIIDATGEIRPAFFFLAAIVALPMPLLYCIDVDRGRRAAARLAVVIEGFRPVVGGSGDDDGNGDGNGDAASDTSGGHTPRAILGDYDDNDDVPVR